MPVPFHFYDCFTLRDLCLRPGFGLGFTKHTYLVIEVSTVDVEKVSSVNGINHMIRSLEQRMCQIQDGISWKREINLLSPDKGYSYEHKSW